MSEICENVDLLGCLDGTASDADVRHVVSCPRCRCERDALERQVRVLTVHFRGAGPCPTPERLVEAALSGETGDANLVDHLNACSDCRTEWKQIQESDGRLRGLEARPVPLPEAVSSDLRRRHEGGTGKVIERADRFTRRGSGDAASSRDTAEEDLPAAAQPEDLTDTSDESPDGNGREDDDT